MIFSGACSCQTGLTGQLTYAAAFSAEPGPWGGAAYTACSLTGKGVNVGMMGEKLFGTDLASYEISVQSRLPTIGVLGLVINKKGTAFLSENALNLGWGKTLGSNMQVGIRLGYQMRTATGYGSEAVPVAGIGLGFKINEQCQWLFQADQVNSFFLKEGDWRYRIRTGMGYRFSKVCFGTMEILAEQNSRPIFIAGVHYSPVDEVLFRVGFSNDMFLLSSSFHYHDFDVGVNSAWHLRLGMSMGLCMGYAFKKN